LRDVTTIYVIQENKFWFEDPKERSDAFSWIMFFQSGLAPMQGQANHFFRYAPEKIPYGIKRYQDETARLYRSVSATFTLLRYCTRCEIGERV
jgi:glutathione S-transferase